MEQIAAVIRAEGVYDPEQGMRRGAGLALTDEGRIAALGTYEEIAAAFPSVRLLDWAGLYVLPGLVNTHVHLEFTPGADAYAVYQADAYKVREKKAEEHAEELLFSGVTAARDLGSSRRLLESLKPGRLRLSFAGPPLTERGGHMGYLGGEADSETELKAAVQQRFEAGCGCVKLILDGGQNTPGSLPERRAYDLPRIRAAVSAAHSLGLPVAAHCLTMASFADAVRAGVDDIEHCACFVRDERTGLLARVWEESLAEGISGRGRFFMAGLSNNYRRLDAVREGRRTPSEAEAFWLLQEEREAAIVRRMAKLGFTLVTGTDAGFGETYFGETWLEAALLVERCGLSNAQALRVATLSGAQALGLGGIAGRTVPGYMADLIALPRNPLEEIRSLSDVRHVMLGGRLIR